MKFNKIYFIDPRDFHVYPRGYNQIMSLDNHGYEVIVIALDWERKYEKVERIYNRSQINRIYPNIWFKHNSKFSVLNSFIIFFYLYKSIFINRPKNLHCHGLIASLIGIFYKLSHGCKVIYDVKEDYRYIHRKQLKIRGFSGIVLKFSDKITSLIESFVFKRADLIFVVPTVDEYLYKYAKNFNKNIFIFKNVPPLKYTIDNNLKKRISEKIGEKFPIIYLGGISKIRGIYKMLSVINMLKNSHIKPILLLVGGITIENINLVKEYIHRLDLDENVFRFGQVKYEKIPTFLSVSKIAFALYEPTFWHLRSKASSKLFVYMRSGVPIVISDFPGIGGIVKECKSGIAIDPDNIEVISRSIIELINNKRKYDIISENGKRAVSNFYNWDKEGIKLISIYKKNIFFEGEKLES